MHVSHIATVELEIKDLDALEAACRQLGLQFNRGQRTYKWYGTRVGREPLPHGFKVEELGKCEHAISVPGNSKAYEIGIAQRRDGQPGYTLLYDYWQGGYGLIEKVGDEKCGKLTQEYAAQVAIKQARKQGFSVTRKVNAQTGQLQLVCRK